MKSLFEKLWLESFEPKKEFVILKSRAMAPSEFSLRETAPHYVDPLKVAILSARQFGKSLTHQKHMEAITNARR